jgi:hypothetical protein
MRPLESPPALPQPAANGSHWGYTGFVHTAMAPCTDPQDRCMAPRRRPGRSRGTFAQCRKFIDRAGGVGRRRRLRSGGNLVRNLMLLAITGAHRGSTDLRRGRRRPEEGDTLSLKESFRPSLPPQMTRTKTPNKPPPPCLAMKACGTGETTSSSSPAYAHIWAHKPGRTSAKFCARVRLGFWGKFPVVRGFLRAIEAKETLAYTAQRPPIGPSTPREGVGAKHPTSPLHLRRLPGGRGAFFGVCQAALVAHANLLCSGNQGRRSDSGWTPSGGIAVEVNHDCRKALIGWCACRPSRTCG